jgi:hypothetical protein
MNEIVKMIRKSGSVDLVLKGETITVGFASSGMTGELIMLGGGFYIVTTTDGRKFEIAKGELVTVA